MPHVSTSHLCFRSTLTPFIARLVMVAGVKGRISLAGGGRKLYAKTGSKEHKQIIVISLIWFSLSLCSVKHRCFLDQALPSQNCTTAHFPDHAHFLAPPSLPPFSIPFSVSSTPPGSPTTVSALQVRSASVRTPDLDPIGPIAEVNGVVGAHIAYS